MKDSTKKLIEKAGKLKGSFFRLGLQSNSHYLIKTKHLNIFWYNPYYNDNISKLELAIYASEADYTPRSEYVGEFIIEEFCGKFTIEENVLLSALRGLKNPNE